MGNNHSSTYPSKKPRKNVHWKSAERPLPPGKPDINPIISDEEQHAIILQWNPPKNDGGAPLVGYQVECNRLGTTVWIRTSPPVITKAELILTGLEPGYKYQFRVSAENAVGVSEPSEYSDILNISMDKSSLTVPTFISGLRDISAMENEKVEFSVSFDGTPPPTIAWFKDGYEIFSSRRTAITTDRSTSVLMFHQTSLNDEGEIKCTATNRAGHIVTRARFSVESVPKIRLPRLYEDGLLYEINETIFFKVSVAGKPAPTVEWRHDGQPLVSNDRIDISNTDKFSVLRINSATRSDRGEYHIYARNTIGEDESSFLVTITAKPDRPGNLIAKLIDDNSVMLSWLAPLDDGGCKIGNYIIEYFRTGWDVWLKASTSRKLSTIISDLIEGSEYRFRVKAESPYGVSNPSIESNPIFVPGKTIGSSTAINATLNIDLQTDDKPEILPRRKRYLSPSKENVLDVSGKIFRATVVRDEKSENILKKDLENDPFSNTDVQKSEPGSSEFMLVLFPDGTKDKLENRKSFQLDLEDALTPPPLSLSAPDLGITHFLPIRPLRNSVSSSELLHEHAMDRFYQAMAIKEAQKSKKKRDSVNASTIKTPKIQIDNVSEDLNGIEEPYNNSTYDYASDETHLVQTEPKIQKHKEKPSENTWKTVSFDEDYSASTASTGGSEISDDSLHDETERNLDIGNEQTTYHPKEMILINKFEVEDDDDIAHKSSLISDPSFIPKPILKRRQNELDISTEVSKTEDKNKNIMTTESKPEKISLFKKITKPQFPKSFSLMKREPKPNKTEKQKIKPSVQVENIDEEPNLSKEKSNDIAPVDDIDGGRIVIEHYGNIVREYGQTRKSPAPLYINTEQLKEAAAVQEHHRTIKPKLQHVKKKIQPKTDRPQTNVIPKQTSCSNEIFNNSKNSLSSKNISGNKLKTLNVKVESENVSRATIVIPKSYSEIESEAKETVRSAIDYTIDVVMLLVAFWLFLFKDERLAVPVLMITVYRQLHEALSNKIPPWFYEKFKQGN